MSPRSHTQLAEIREKSRNKILMAALKLFSEQGFHNTSISQIAKSAEVAKGLVYNYFESKEALLEGIVAQSLAESADIFDRIGQQPSPKGKMEQVIHITFDYLVQRYDYYKLLTGLALQLDQFPQLRETIEQKYIGMMPYMSMLLKELNFENPEEEAYKLAALLDGIGLQFIVLKDAFPLEKMRTYLLETYCK